MAKGLSTPPLRSVSDTALYVAYHRSLENERPDAIFHDRHARALAGDSGERIARSLFWGRRNAWSTIVRTALFDELILKTLQDGETDVVLNLAAGLDARPFRMALPESLLWVEVDLPDVLAYKAEKLAGEAPNFRLAKVAIDLTRVDERRALFTRIGGAANKVLVLAEGLLAYLAPEQVGELAADLHAQPNYAHWIVDLASPLVVRRTNKVWGKALRAAGAMFRFGPPEGPAFFLPYGWREAEFHDLIEASRRFNRRMPFYWLLSVQQRLFPRRTQRKLAAWRSGVLLLARR